MMLIIHIFVLISIYRNRKKRSDFQQRHALADAKLILSTVNPVVLLLFNRQVRCGIRSIFSRESKAVVTGMKPHHNSSTRASDQTNIQRISGSKCNSHHI
ncbi:hypothetical protein COOONC_02344 [Cooperia oncophora]